MNWPYPDERRFPIKDFDLIKEGTVSLLLLMVVILVIAAFAGAPYRPTVTNKDIALNNPVFFAQTALGYLDGSDSIASYGPPYNHGWQGQTTGVQSIAEFHPQTWWGVPYPVQPVQDFILTPLSSLATASHNSILKDAVQVYQTSPYSQQMRWNANYKKALSTAKVVGHQLYIIPGDYGPVDYLMQSELAMAQSGLLSGVLNSETNQGVYRWNVQNDLLFLQGKPLHDKAKNLNMLGEQWGINHDERAYPGPWWLTPYTFLYQVPPWSVSPAGDLMAAYTVAILFLLLMFLPWIPGLNRLPRILPLYKLIWRGWYRYRKEHDL